MTKPLRKQERRRLPALERRNAALTEMNRRLKAEIKEHVHEKSVLRIGKAWLQAVLDHSPEVIFVKDARGRYRHVNRQFERLFDRPRGNVIGRTDREIFPRAHAAAFQTNDRKVLRKGVPLQFEENARYYDGIHSSIVSKFPLRDPKGKIYGLGGIATDITARKLDEEALRLSEERFRLLVASVRDYAIHLLTPDGRVASWNAGAERIYGYRGEEIIGRHFSCFYLPEEIQTGKPARDLNSSLREGRFEREGWRMRKDGVRFWANVVRTPVYGEAGRLIGFATVTRDMTERKEVEEALIQSEEHYRRLFNEAQAMQENLRNLSHRILHVQEEERRRISRELHDEIGQSLTAVSVTLATLRNNGATTVESLSRKIASIQQLLEQAMGAIHRFARELRPAMLDELGLLPALRSHVKNFSEHTGLLTRLRADPIAEHLDGEQKTALFRIVQESLTNVVKHARADRVDISIRKTDEGVCMEIADDGKSFRNGPKNSAGRRQHLGLLGMQERVRLINGRFAIEPKPGRGTTVRVTIPFKPAGGGM